MAKATQNMPVLWKKPVGLSYS